MLRFAHVFCVLRLLMSIRRSVADGLLPTVEFSLAGPQLTDVTEAVADLDQMVSTQTQELKLQLLHDWSHAFAQGNRKIDDAFRIARKRGASRNVPFLDGAFDVARVFRVNVEHMGDIADTTEFFKLYRNDVNGSMAQFFSAEAKAFGIVVDQIVAIVRAALRLPHETEAFLDTSSLGFKVVAPEGVYPSPVAIVEDFESRRAIHFSWALEFLLRLNHDLCERLKNVVQRHLHEDT